MSKANFIRVLLVEDNRLVIHTIRGLLQKYYPHIEVIGDARDGEEALLLVEQLEPTAVVMDINIPRLDGIAATRRIKNSYPQIAVVGLSVNAHGYFVDAMLKAGAFEVLSKEKSLEDLYGAIQRAVASIQPILFLERTPASAESHVESEESVHLNPKNVLSVEESQEGRERESGSEK